VDDSTWIVRSGFTTNLTITANRRLIKQQQSDADGDPEQVHRIQQARDQA
jgi:hypothetical protein